VGNLGKLLTQTLFGDFGFQNNPIPYRGAPSRREIGKQKPLLGRGGLSPFLKTHTFTQIWGLKPKKSAPRGGGKFFGGAGEKG